MNNRLSYKKKKIESYNIFSESEVDILVMLSSVEIQKIFSWKILAQKAGVTVHLSDFKNNKDWNKINSLYDFNFYKIRYSKYDYNKIYEYSLKEMNKKRGSIYDPENIAKRKKYH